MSPGEIGQPYSMCPALGHPLSRPQAPAGPMQRASMSEILRYVGCEIFSLPRSGGAPLIDYGRAPIEYPRYVKPTGSEATEVQQLQSALAGLGGPGMDTRHRQHASRLTLKT